MNDDQAKLKIGRFLEVNGFTVEYLSEEGKEQRRSADLRVSENVYTYYIEIKTKGDDEEKLVSERQELLNKGVVNRSESLGRRNRLSGIIRDAVSQLRDYPCGDKCFKLIWMHCVGYDPVLQFEQIQATLYGKVLLEGVSGQKRTYEIRPCYFFSFNEFFDLKNELHAVIISSEKEMQLCINSVSPLKHQLRQSGLYKWLEGGICDPEFIEQSGGAYCSDDCHLSRHNESAVLDFVRHKYQAPGLIVSRMKRHSGTILLPKEEPNF